LSECSYPYAVSRIKVSEDSLIDQSQWNRLWEAGLDEAYRLLHEMGYGQKAKDQNDIDSLTRANVAQARELIREVSPNHKLTDLLLLQTDAHNIKTVLKGMLEEEEVDSILLEGGSIPLPVLLESFEKDSFDAFPEKLREAVDRFSPDMAPRELSAMIDDSVFEQIDFVLSNKKSTDPLMKRYFDSKTDFTNILTLLRIRNLKWSAEQLKPLIIPGGAVPEEKLMEAVDVPVEQLPDMLSAGEDDYFIKGFLREFERDGSISNLAMKFSRRSYQIAHQAYMETFGMGPIMNYLIQKEYEARMLRILFAGKRSGKQVPLAELGLA
jgi:V/A-type H+-transporting ATPase subunit C